MYRLQTIVLVVVDSEHPRLVARLYSTTAGFHAFLTRVPTEKALEPSWVLSGTVTETSAVQLPNAHSPMLVNPSGKVTEVSPVH